MDRIKSGKYKKRRRMVMTMRRFSYWEIMYLYRKAEYEFRKRLITARDKRQPRDLVRDPSVHCCLFSAPCRQPAWSWTTGETASDPPGSESCPNRAVLSKAVSDNDTVPVRSPWQSLPLCKQWHWRLPPSAYHRTASFFALR